MPPPPGRMASQTCAPAMIYREQPQRDEPEEPRQRQLVGLLHGFAQRPAVFPAAARAVFRACRSACCFRTTLALAVEADPRGVAESSGTPRARTSCSSRRVARSPAMRDLKRAVLSSLAWSVGWRAWPLRMMDPWICRSRGPGGSGRAGRAPRGCCDRSGGSARRGPRRRLGQHRFPAGRIGGQLVNPAGVFLRIRLLAQGGFSCEPPAAARRGF